MLHKFGQKSSHSFRRSEKYLFISKVFSVQDALCLVYQHEENDNFLC